MGVYDRWILPRILDYAMRQPPIPKQRDKVVPRAEGRILEIGIGSGLNLAYYDREKVSKLWGLDPSMELRRLAERRSAEAGLEVDFVGLSGESIPLDDAAVDTIVCTYTLCTIPDPRAALAEMRRVLRPGGRILFSEHGRAPDPEVVAWQDRINPYWNKIAGGCNLNRKVDDLLTNAGFTIELEQAYLPGPRPWSYNYWGAGIRGA